MVWRRDWLTRREHGVGKHWSTDEESRLVRDWRGPWVSRLAVRARCSRWQPTPGESQAGQWVIFCASMDIAFWTFCHGLCLLLLSFLRLSWRPQVPHATLTHPEVASEEWWGAGCSGEGSSQVKCPMQAALPDFCISCFLLRVSVLLITLDRRMFCKIFHHKSV